MMGKLKRRCTSMPESYSALRLECLLTALVMPGEPVAAAQLCSRHRHCWLISSVGTSAPSAPTLPVSTSALARVSVATEVSGACSFSSSLNEKKSTNTSQWGRHGFWKLKLGYRREPKVDCPGGGAPSRAASSECMLITCPNCRCWPGGMLGDLQPTRSLYWPRGLLRLWNKDFERHQLRFRTQTLICWFWLPFVSANNYLFLIIDFHANLWSPV